MKLKVLYVEDEIFLGKIVKETLEMKGFDVNMESNGLNVMDLFESYHPDICILDIMLPGKNGFEIAAEMRKINPTVPILFLSAKVQTEDIVNGFKIGGNDYIRKPFSIEELIVRIENLIGAIKESPSLKEEERIGSFVFHINKQLLVHETIIQKLSFRETELLKLLWVQHNHIVQRKDLLNHIWGNDSFFNSRNLDVYITKLRSYFKLDPSIEIITIKGVGYRFITG